MVISGLSYPGGWDEQAAPPCNIGFSSLSKYLCICKTNIINSKIHSLKLGLNIHTHYKITVTM